MSEKIIGYLLLIAGIVTIVFCGFNVYSVFTRQINPIQLFNFPSISVDLGKMLSGSLPPEAAQMLANNPQAATELVSADMINATSNIIFHLMLMGFIASLGYKIATLGIQLLRPIVVKLKAQSEAKN